MATDKERIENILKNMEILYATTGELIPANTYSEVDAHALVKTKKVKRVKYHGNLIELPLLKSTGFEGTFLALRGKEYPVNHGEYKKFMQIKYKEGLDVAREKCKMKIFK